MLGHLKVANCSTNETFKDSFQLSYCSICENLRTSNSLIHSAFLNIEMTIALMALDDFFVFENEFTKCPTSFNIAKKKIYKNKAVDTAGNLSIILGWLKSVDLKEDKPNLFGIGFIEKKLRKNVKKFNNTISNNTFNIINEYIEFIKIKTPDFNTLLHLTGNLSKTLFLEIANNTNIGDNLKKELAKLFYDLGKIILYSDHLLDIEKDIKENNYNPISVNSKLSNLEDAYNLFYLKYITVLQFTKQLLKNQNFNKDFVKYTNKALSELNNKIYKFKAKFFPNSHHNIKKIDLYNELILNDSSLILAQNSCCSASDVCEYDGICSRKTCYGGDCGDVCCGCVNDKGFSCCGYSFLGECLTGYTNGCDCMCGTGTNRGCCCSFSLWKDVAILLFIGWIINLIFDNFWIILLLVAVGVGFAIKRFLKNNK